MKLPSHLQNSQEWTLVGPMGPQVPAELLAHSVLGVDGGARFCPKIDFWVGDGDSYPFQINCEHIVKFSPQKSSSDLALSLSFFDSLGPRILHLWGFLGGRKDHELFNLGEALRFLEGNCFSTITFYDPQGNILIKCFGAGEQTIRHTGIFSLASMKKITIKLTGRCEYKLEEERELLPFSSLGLSNTSHGDFTIFSSGPFMLIFPEIS